MKKEALRKISKGAKIEFLNKLQSGKFELIEAYNPAPKLNFDLIPESGLYKCRETGKEMSKEKIEALPGYQIKIELIQDLKEPPAGFELHPYSREQYLDSLLKNPDDKYLSSEEAKELLNDLDAGDFDKVRL